MSISTPYIDISWWIKKRYRKYIYKRCDTIAPSSELTKGEGRNPEAAPVSTFISSLTLTTSGETYCSGSMKRAIAFVCLYQDVDVFMVYTGDGYTCNFFHSENKYMTRQQFRKMRLERAFLISGYGISAMAFAFFMVTFCDQKKN